VLQALQRAGFFVHHTSGSHYILKHPDKPTLRVTVPYHNKDLKRRTLASIIEQAGMTVDEFIQLL
jgi:predicted RNA binding protein YcfA (HicA-like mRNA interferase family)